MFLQNTSVWRRCQKNNFTHSVTFYQQLCNCNLNVCLVELVCGLFEKLPLLLYTLYVLLEGYCKLVKLMKCYKTRQMVMVVNVVTSKFGEVNTGTWWI